MQSLIDQSDRALKIEVVNDKVKKISQQIGQCERSLGSYSNVLEVEVAATLEMQVEAFNEVKTLLAQMFEQKQKTKEEEEAAQVRLREEHQSQVSDLHNKIQSIEDDLARVVAELKEQDRINKVLKEECEDRIAAVEQREDNLRIEMMNKENQLSDKLLTESLKLQALNEKEYRDMERRYMRDFSMILGIDQPQKMVDYETFIEMAKSKVQRLSTKIDLLMCQREPNKVGSSQTLTQNYLNEAEYIKQHGIVTDEGEAEHDQRLFDRRKKLLEQKLAQSQQSSIYSDQQLRIAPQQQSKSPFTLVSSA